MNKCYIRVSRNKQDYDRQESILKENGYINGTNCIYIEEKFTGKRADRPALLSLIDNLQPNDTVIACELSRISRSVKDFNNLIDIILKEKKANIIILKENFNLKANGNMDAMTRLILNITSAFAEFERDLISDRTKEALRAKKLYGTKSGEKVGRKRGKKSTFENFKKTLSYMVENKKGYQRACKCTKYPTDTFKKDIKKMYNKFEVKDYDIILEEIEKGGFNSWEQF